MDHQAEARLQAVIYPDLERGRPGWDLPHTKSVVRYMKNIVDANPAMKLDHNVLVIAAYAHDWGWTELFEQGRPAAMEDYMDKKTLHMQLGSQKIEELLKDKAFDYLYPEHKKRIVHLVAVHDKLPELKDTDELVLMEADTLGASDNTPTHTRAEYESWLKTTLEERVTRFITAYSRDKIQELLKKRKQYYDNHLEL